MSDHSSGSEADEPLIEPKSILKTMTSKLKKQASFELRNLPSVDKKENKNDEDQILEILDSEEAVEEKDEPSDVVHLNRNSTFNRSQQRKNTDILDSAEVKDLSWTQRYVIFSACFRKKENCLGFMFF